MKPSWGIGWACALAALAALAAGGSVARAGWCDGVLVCGSCRSSVSVNYYAPAPCPPPVTAYSVQRCYYEPPCRCHCGPIRRLLGICCKPRCCPPPVAVAAAPCPSPAPVIVPAPIMVPAPGPSPLPVDAAPRGGYERNYPPLPQSPAPPPAGSTSRRTAPLTPPLPPQPIRLDRIVSNADRQASSQTPAVPASRTRPAGQD